VKRKKRLKRRKSNKGNWGKEKELQLYYWRKLLFVVSKSAKRDMLHKLP
jgi:hypothetical protein